ncbi:MAG: exodeoxyribonuclease III [Frankiaceae bacterium]
MRLATWNVNSIKPRLPRLLDWLAATAPDVVALQETKCAADAFPRAEIGRLGYDSADCGTGRWNGVALLSRVGLADVRSGLDNEPGNPGIEPRALAATCGGVRMWSVYVPNGRVPDSEHYAYKLAWLQALRATVSAELPGHSPLVVCGDFNVAPTDADVWDPAAFTHSTHVTPAERAELAQFRGLGLTDIRPRPLKGPNPFTYWDYRAGMFHKDMGMRIDHVYADAALAGRVRDAYIDREARKGQGPSDHAPVVVDVTVPPRSQPRTTVPVYRE